MRRLPGLVAASALAGGIGACAAIAGLSPYSSAQECQGDTCDAATSPNPPDATIGTPDGSTGDHKTAPGDDEAGVEAGCADTTADPNNCGRCGAVCAEGEGCSGGQCTPMAGAADGGDSGIPCPSDGCPTSTPTGFSCPFGHCNGATSECSGPSGCFCSDDSQCKSGKCVKVTRENDLSCGNSCTGSGSRDGYNCELASPGIPSLAGGTYSCPTNSGYKSSTLACDPTHTNCYCTSDGECPSGKCVSNSNNNNCSGCTGTGTPDFRGCQATTVIGYCPFYIGCPANTLCQYPTCYCFADVACASGHCIPSAHNNNCASPAGPCTGTGTDDGNGCVPAPSSVACVGSGGTMCITTLTPAPVLNAAKTACLCVDDSSCSSGKCVNKDAQCTGTCSGSGSADSEDCQTASSVANTWSCSIGNCDNVSSPTGQCTAQGLPCWCTSDSQCPMGTLCATWAGCGSGACSGTATAGNPFHCVRGP
jgi:hypothetical protein